MATIKPFYMKKKFRPKEVTGFVIQGNNLVVKTRMGGRYYISGANLFMWLETTRFTLTEKRNRLHLQPIKKQ